MVSCGEKDPNAPKKSKLLSTELKNTSWEMPGYEVAGFSMYEDTASISMSATSFISNATIVVLDESKKGDFVVFNMYTDTGDNRVLGVSILSNDMIRVSIINADDDIEGYRATHEGALGVNMTKVQS